MMKSWLIHIDAIVEGGGCVLSAESAVIQATVQRTIESGSRATFYLSKAQFDEINAWYWTPERRSQHGMEEVSAEEGRKIERELGITDAGFKYSNRIPCGNCGAVYGAFEFIQQGIKEHGKAMVESTFGLASAAVLRVNPSTVAVCQSCDETLRIVGGIVVPHEYSMAKYGCCFGGGPALQQ